MSGPTSDLLRGTEVFQPVLVPGEVLVWYGQPQTHTPRTKGYVNIVTGIGWGLLAASAVLALAMISERSANLASVGGVAALFGLGWYLGLRWEDRLKRFVASHHYAVTSRRVLQFVTWKAPHLWEAQIGPGSILTSIPPHPAGPNLPAVWGSLEIGPWTSKPHFARRVAGRLGGFPSGFRFTWIEDSRGVYAMLRHMKATALHAGSSDNRDITP